MALSGYANTSTYDGRYYQVDWTATQSVANNKSTIKWTLSAKGGNDSWYAERTLNVTIAGTSVYSKTSRVERYTGTITSGTIEISHNSVGAASFQISINAAVYGSSVNCTGTGTFTLNTIPRKSTLSVGNGTLNTSQTLTVTRQATSFTHTITYKCGSATGTICTKSTSTSISFTPPLSLANQNTTGTSLSITYTITTYSGSTNVGSNAYTKTLTIPASVKPSVTFTVSEANNVVANSGAANYVQNYSKLKVVLSVTTSYGSAISSYRTTIDGKTYTSSSFTSSVLLSSGTLTINTTITDKRGRTGTYSKTITIQPYANPTFNMFKVHRCDADGVENIQGEYGRISFECICSKLLNTSGVSFNTPILSIAYKKTSEITYTNNGVINCGVVEGTTGVISDIIDYPSLIFPASSDTTYNVKITITDAITSNLSRTTVLSTGFSIMHFLANGFGIALGKIAELTNVLDIGFKTRFTGGILQPVLEAGTDFDSEEMRISNTYTLKSVNNAAYVNCPLTSGTGTLTVETFGEEGQTRQIVEVCHKTNPIRYERYYYQNAWGEWINTECFGGKVLWSGAYYMHDTQEINLSEPISKQKHGVVLVFSPYSDGVAADYDFNHHFVSKLHVKNHPGKGVAFNGSNADASYYMTKYLYISDTSIKGYAKNDDNYTSTCGITISNMRYVLRYVIGV